MKDEKWFMKEAQMFFRAIDMPIDIAVFAAHMYRQGRADQNEADWKIANSMVVEKPCQLKRAIMDAIRAAGPEVGE